jgi:predicted SAM-dependent methyltransferase
VTRVAVTRIDGNEKIAPDIRCDLRDIPVSDGYFDLVHARHVLEHFPRDEAPRALREWLRILRPGGTLEINVPNVLVALEAIKDIEEGRAEPSSYPWWQLYGAQTDHRDFHGNGFTPRKLRKLLEYVGLADIDIQTDHINIEAVARKPDAAAPVVDLVTIWDGISERNGVPVVGLVPASSNGHALNIVYPPETSATEPDIAPEVYAPV